MSRLLLVAAAVAALAGCGSSCHQVTHDGKKACKVVHGNDVEYVPIIIPIYHPPPVEEDPVPVDR